MMLEDQQDDGISKTNTVLGYVEGRFDVAVCRVNLISMVELFLTEYNADIGGIEMKFEHVRFYIIGNRMLECEKVKCMKYLMLE